jgi:hypothetical protein
MIFLSFLFSACAQKEVVFEDKLVCSEQIKIDRPKADLRVKKADIDVALAFKEAINSSFDFYENQVNQNNKLCEEIKNENIR